MEFLKAFDDPAQNDELVRLGLVNPTPPKGDKPVADAPKSKKLSLPPENKKAASDEAASK